MVRYKYIEKLVLNIYRAMPELTFPIDPKKVIELIPNCEYMSYQTFSRINHCPINTVIKICESNSGCVQYDIANDRYLILCNEGVGTTKGRQRWTCAHEIGHVLCKHLKASAFQMMSENNLMEQSNAECEKEADGFASILLSPFPLFSQFGVSCAEDIKHIFGLSKTASEYRYNSYQKWQDYRITSAWSNDIVWAYREKAWS